MCDTFNRANSLDLGVTEDANHWTWFKSKSDIQILGGGLRLPTGGCAGPDRKSDGSLFRPADFDLRATLRSTSTLTHEGPYCVIGYRNDSYSAQFPYSNNGYTMWVWGTTA